MLWLQLFLLFRIFFLFGESFPLRKHPLNLLPLYCVAIQGAMFQWVFPFFESFQCVDGGLARELQELRGDRLDRRHDRRDKDLKRARQAVLDGLEKTSNKLFQLKTPKFRGGNTIYAKSIFVKDLPFLSHFARIKVYEPS